MQTGRDVAVYTQQMLAISEYIMNSSNRISLMNLVKFKGDMAIFTKIYDTSLSIIKKYRLFIDYLLDTTPPFMVQAEHEDMIRAVQMYIDGSQSMYSAIDIKKCAVNREMLKRGLQLQIEGAERALYTAGHIRCILIG